MTNRVTPLDDNIYIRQIQHVLERNNIMTNKKQFDVLAIDPTTGRETTFRSVSADRLFTNEHGETRYRYNHHYTDVETISVTEIPQAKLDAELAYFTKYGTKGE